MTLDRKLIKVVLLTSVFVYRVGKNPLVADGGGLIAQLAEQLTLNQ